MTGSEKIALVVFVVMVACIAFAGLLVMLGMRPTVGIGS